VGVREGNGLERSTGSFSCWRRWSLALWLWFCDYPFSEFIEFCTENCRCSLYVSCTSVTKSNLIFSKWYKSINDSNTNFQLRALIIITEWIFKERKIVSYFNLYFS
jgi:hypothetical protein